MPKIKIKFPNGSVTEFDKGVTAIEVAKSIGERLAMAAIAAKVNGQKFKDKKLDPKNPYRIHAWGDFYSNQYAKNG